MMRKNVLCVGAAFLLSVAAAAPASAAVSEEPVTLTAQMPVDVRAQFDGPALREAAEIAASFAAQYEPNSGPPPLDLSGNIKAGPVHQIYFFTEEFVEGSVTAPAVEAEQTWISSIQRDGKVIGTLRIFKPDGGPARLAVSNGNVELGQALDATTAKALVEVPWNRSFYTVVDDVVTPVDTAARAQVPSAAELDAVQDVVVEQVAEDAALAESVGPAAVAGASLAKPARTLADERSDVLAVTGLGIAVLGVGGLVLLRRRREEVNPQA